jgi:hypothetical protein
MYKGETGKKLPAYLPGKFNIILVEVLAGPIKMCIEERKFRCRKH